MHSEGVILRSLLILLATLLISACDTGGKKPLRIGMDMSYPPFETLGTNGQPEGVSVELAKALGENLGRPVVFENMPFDGLIPALKTGRVDAVISSMSATAERAESIDFSEPYLRTGLCLLAGAKSDVNTPDDLDRAGKKVAVVRGTTGHIWAKSSLRNAEILDLANESACVLEVTQGKADAFIYDQMSTLRNWQANPGSTRAILTPFRNESWAVALRKGDSDLREKVNAFLTTYRAGGGFDRLGEKWLHEQKAAFAKLGVPFVF